MESVHNRDIEKISDSEIEIILKQANRGIVYQRFVDDWAGSNSPILTIVRKETYCALCGKLPCGEDTTLVLNASNDGGKSILLEGVCSSFKPLTKEQSELKIHYRSYLTSQRDLPKRYVVYTSEDGKVTPYGSPLPE